MSDEQYESTASSGCESESEEQEKFGKWIPQKLEKFERGTQLWQNFVTDTERQLVTDAFTKLVTNPKKSLHHRLPELIWYARQLEFFLYDGSTSKEIYFLSVDKRIPYLKSQLKMIPHWAEMKACGDIPCTDDLEKLFCTKGPRLPYVELQIDDELLAEGGTIVSLITEEQFNEHICPVNTRTERKIIEPERRKQRVVKNGPGNRKILMARYANREMAESNSMTFSYEEATS